jgi:hypothetical protein
MQFHHRPVIAYQKMFYVQLGALRQNLRQLVKGMCEKISFRVIVPGKRVCPLDNPVDILGDMLEEPFTITRFEILKDLANRGGGQPLRIRDGGHGVQLPPYGSFDQDFHFAFPAASQYTPKSPALGAPGRASSSLLRVAAATPGSSELQYATGFLRRLDHWESEAKGQHTYYVEGFGLVGEADLGRFLPNFSQFITMAGEEQWHDMQIGDTFEGTAFDKPVRLTRRS